MRQMGVSMAWLREGLDRSRETKANAATSRLQLKQVNPVGLPRCGAAGTQLWMSHRAIGSHTSVKPSERLSGIDTMHCESTDDIRRMHSNSQTLGWLRLDPRMDPLRKQACYAEVTQRLWQSP